MCPIIRVSNRCVCAIIGASLCASASVCDLLIERETETETQIQSEINRGSERKRAREKEEGFADVFLPVGIA